MWGWALPFSVGEIVTEARITLPRVRQFSGRDDAFRCLPALLTLRGVPDLADAANR
jgi:hypothetical protein